MTTPLQQGLPITARKLMLLYVALPVAYAVTGRLGALLAISPGYATAVFLPAGMAVAAAFVSGPVSLPGTLLGSFLLNVWIGYSSGHHIDGTRIATAAVISFGSALQAAAGGMLLRRAIGYPAPLDNPRDLSAFLLLSPLICFTSATLSLGGMLALGAIAPADFAVNWVTWWVGDTLGVLVAVPLVLLFAGEPRSLWRLRQRYVGIPIVLGFALFVAIFARVRGWEEKQSLVEYQMRSQQLADALKSALDEQALFLEQLSSAFAHRRQVVLTRDDFHFMAQPLLKRFPQIQAVEWAPFIRGNERDRFEAAQQNDIPGYRIRERHASEEMLPAGARDEFYPVTYIEPLAGNEAAAGFDLASEPLRRAAIKAATGSGGVIATPPVHLVQEGAAEAGVLLTRAASNDPTGVGVVLVVLRVAPFMAALLAPLNTMLCVRFLDVSSGLPLFDDLPVAESPGFQKNLYFGTRQYLVQTAPSAAYIASHRGWESFAVLAGGVLSTGLLGGLLMLGTGHTYRIERLAEKLGESEARKADLVVELRTKQAELETIMAGTPFMLVRCSRDLHYRYASPAYAAMLNRRGEDFAGRSVAEIIGQRGLSAILPHVERVLQGERVQSEDRIEYQGVGTRFVHAVYTPDWDPGGAVVGWIASIIDITERKRIEAQRDLLIAEVNHRVKNTLATVISIAHQSFRKAQNFDVALRSFDNRIRALAQTHTRLSEANWSDISLKAIIDDEIAPYRTDHNVRIRGPEVGLNPRCAVSLGMALHELTTNAAKYGALSVEFGCVDVSWEVDLSENRVRFSWVESGGPMVSQPQHSGFGRLLLEKVLASDLNGSVSLEFGAAGLSCVVAFPVGTQRSDFFRDAVA